MEQTVRLQQTAHSDSLNNNNNNIYVFYYASLKALMGQQSLPGSARAAGCHCPGSVVTPAVTAEARQALAYLGTRCGHFAHTQLHTGFGGLGWEGRAGGRPGSGEWRCFDHLWIQLLLLLAHLQ